MIQFDPGQTILLNVGIDVFAIAIMLIIHRSYRQDFADTPDIRLMYRINLTVIWILLVDILMWLTNGKAGKTMRIIGYVDNMAYFILQFVAAFFWLRYAWGRIFGHAISRRIELLCVRIPFFALNLCLLSTPWTHWYFYLDELNRYRRGVLSIPMFVINLFYLAVVSAAALVQYRKEVFLDRKRELAAIAFFAVPPLFGGAMQILIYGISLIWPSTILSCLLVLLAKESQAIARDPLTGLNNRRNMEKYLKMYGGREQFGALAVIVIDINNFKQINDRYGHNVGDEALIRAANILRITLSGTPAVLSRYGGDEFVILLPDSDEESAKEAVHRIEVNFTKLSETSQLPFPMSVSIGWDLSAEKGRRCADDLLRRADENMYREKARYHRQGE